jgi:bifunctional NMN adenylyltransferase/nudix hydrolase
LQQVDDTEGIEVSKRQYNLATFVGRLEPLHNGHIPNIEKALEIADHVLVIVGSANQPRTPRNPFTADERIAMIKSVFPDDRVQAVGVEDYYPDALWLQSVQTAVHKHLIDNRVNTQTAKVAILGHKILDASVIRDHYFAGEFDAIIPDVPVEVLAFLDKFSKTPEYKLLVEEQEYITRYKEEWDAAPYPPTFVTTDAVVVQSGHVLLVKRRTAPGKGLWALPGGFINQHERLDECVIRELREETKVKVPVAVLEGSIKHKHTTVFDAPNRSLRGRTITNAFLIDLKPWEAFFLKITS